MAAQTSGPHSRSRRAAGRAGFRFRLNIGNRFGRKKPVEVELTAQSTALIDQLSAESQEKPARPAALRDPGSRTAGTDGGMLRRRSGSLPERAATARADSLSYGRPGFICYQH